MRTTGDPVFELIAGVYRQAVTDAKRGDLAKAAWLDLCCRDWRQMDKRKPTRGRAAMISHNPENSGSSALAIKEKESIQVTNMQLLSLALSYATGRSARYWTKVLQGIAKSDPVIADNLAKIPPDHLDRLEKLQQESSGILQWLLTK